MPSNRGRKRNDNLPPNWARDVQRAFRARRAAHLEALERRVTELEDENEYFRQVLNLPPPSRPPLGKGPTGNDQPYQGANKSRPCETISPESSVGSLGLSSYTSSPELGPSLIAPAISSCTMTMIDAGPSHWMDAVVENERHTHKDGYSIGQSIPPMPFKASNSPDCSDHIPPSLHSSLRTIYPHMTPASYSPTSNERDFDARERGEPCVKRREALNEARCGTSQNYQNSEQILQTGVSMYRSYHVPQPIHREWNPLPSDHVYTPRDLGIPESR